MAKKDVTITENSDHEQKGISPGSPAGESRPSSPEEKGSEAADVKNANATGDGSFGRSESSLPDEEGEASPKKDSTY